MCSCIRHNSEPTDDQRIIEAFEKFKDADNAFECILEAVQDMDRKDTSIKRRMTKLGLKLPDEFEWTLEARVLSFMIVFMIF